jgi:hypothetical protein
MYVPGPMEAPVQMIRDKLATGLLPRQDATKTFGGYGRGAPCASCDLAIHASEVEYEVVFAHERSYAFHIECANIWRALKSAPAGAEWRVTCSCGERVAFADTLAEAEALGRELETLRLAPLQDTSAPTKRGPRNPIRFPFSQEIQRPFPPDSHAMRSPGPRRDSQTRSTVNMRRVDFGDCGPPI